MSLPDDTELRPVVYRDGQTWTGGYFDGPDWCLVVRASSRAIAVRNVVRHFERADYLPQITPREVRIADAESVKAG